MGQSAEEGGQAEAVDRHHDCEDPGQRTLFGLSMSVLTATMNLKATSTCGIDHFQDGIYVNNTKNEKDAIFQIYENE